MNRDRLLLLDYGGVLGDHHQEPAESHIAAVLGVDVPTCRRLLSEKGHLGRQFREDRLTEREFWLAVADEARVDVATLPDPTVLSRLWAETYRLNKEMLALLLQIRDRAYVGILTNVDRARGAYLEETLHVPEHLDIYLPSYRYGSIKPAIALWQSADAAIRDALGNVTTYYVDDRKTHLDACAMVGWRGLIYEGIDPLYRWLKSERFIVNEVRV